MMNAPQGKTLMDILSGQSFGRYHILEPLGEGGMATVYKAFDTRLEREVAVKVIRREAFPPNQLERILARFEREAKSLARLNHSNIVTVIDYGEQDGKPYLVMPYITGGTLKDQLGRPMPWQDAAKILLSVARGLAYAHQRGIVHRDVKPSNILITESGDPLLTDFGIAKLLEGEDGQTLTGTGVGIGTPEYMAPEQGMGREIDGRADLYALGIVFYELLTGRKPYTADTPMAVVLKHVTDPLPRPAQFAPGLPDAVEKLILKALAKQPEDRHASMDDFVRALETLLKTRPRVEKVSPAAPAPLPPVDPQATRDELVVTPPASPKRAHEENPQPDYTPQSAPARRRIPAWLWAVGGLALLLIFVLTLINLPKPVVTSPLPVPTDTSNPTMTASPTATATLTTAPAPTHTATPRPTSTPTPGIGSTLTRKQDGMLMVYVPAGPFEMGSNNGDSDEKPVHTVSLDAFWMDQTEVTNAMYALCAQAGVCDPPGNTTYYRDGAYGNHPVVSVNWQQASDYCAWAGSRLPTEAEWEKAARGGLEGKKHPWGDEAPTCQAGARNGAQYSGCSGRTVSVGTFQPNGYGLYDMAGNVWEWVADWYSANYYSNSPSSNPTGPESGSTKVLRGGSWDGSAGEGFRSASRNWCAPGVTYGYLGFRCLRSP
jgi:serine/threonine-protein kinase